MDKSIEQQLWSGLIPLLLFNAFFLITLTIFAFSKRWRLSQEEAKSMGESAVLPSFLREWWLWIIKPILNFCIRNKVSPNTLTTISLLFAGGAGFSYHLGLIGMGGWMIIASSIFDIIDGKVARANDQSTKAGGFYDSTIDRYCESITFLGLISFFRNSWIFWVTLTAFIGSMMISYTRARASEDGMTVYKGFMNRPERIAYLGVGSIFSPIMLYLTYDWMGNVHWVLIIELIFIGLMTNVVVVIRIMDIFKKYKGQKQTA